MLHRHPLYLIVRMLCYDDGLGAGKNLLALKTTDAEQEECNIWVYQCSSSVSFAGFGVFKKNQSALSINAVACFLGSSV